MAGLGFFHGVDGEKAEGVDGKLVDFVLLGVLRFAHAFPLLVEDTRRAWRR